MSQGSGIPAELDTQMTPAVRAFVVALLARIDGLESEVRDLNRRLGQADRFRRDDGGQTGSAGAVPTTEAAKDSRKRKRKRGAQPGHPRHERTLIPTTECDHVEVLTPPACRRCGFPLSGSDPEPLRHQVYELPEIRLEVTEYQRHRLNCPCCGISTCAELPPGVPTGQSGPRLVAFVTLLMAMFRQSKRRVSLFCETLLGHSMSAGLVVKLQNQATEALRPAYDELVAEIPRQQTVWADETTTRQENRNAWIWTVVATSFTVFTVRLTKAACVIKELLTEQFKGVVTSDRAKTYHWIKWHQWCWAHLKRDFEAMALRAGQAGEVGRRLLDCTRRLFDYCRRIRDGDITRRGFYRQISLLRAEVEAALADGEACADRSTAATCAELLDRFENLWVFHYHSGVEPTNNAAERSLRHAVIWRHLSFGTQSAAGSRFVETLLTVIETCRQQKRNTFEFLCQALASHFARQPHPSLLSVP